MRAWCLIKLTPAYGACWARCDQLLLGSIATAPRSPETRCLTQIISQRLGIWRAAAASSSISPPKFVSADWRVDIKASAADVQRTAEPSVLLNLQVQRNASEAGHMPGVDTVTAELSAPALATLLEGLHKIRDQLKSASQ